LARKVAGNNEQIVADGAANGPVIDVAASAISGLPANRKGQIAHAIVEIDGSSITPFQTKPGRHGVVTGGEVNGLWCARRFADEAADLRCQRLQRGATAELNDRLTPETQ
jgi:hypothetical protein